MQQAQRAPDDGVVVRPVPGRCVRLGTSEPGPQHRHHEQVEQPVQDGLLPQLVPADLIHQQWDDRAVPLAVAQHDTRREGIEQPPADLARGLVRADEHDGRTFRGVAPGAHALIH